MGSRSGVRGWGRPRRRPGRGRRSRRRRGRIALKADGKNTVSGDLICPSPVSLPLARVPVDDRLVLLGLLDELVEGLEIVVDVVGALEEVSAVHGVRVVAHVVVRVTRGKVVLVGRGRPLRRAGRVARVGVLQLLKRGDRK